MCGSSRAGPSREVRRAALALSRAVERRAPGAGQFEMVEGGAPRRVPRLQPEREGSHHLLRVFRAPAAGRARVRRRFTGTKCRTASRPTSPCSRCRSASPSSAIRTRAWTPRRARSTSCSNSRRETRRPVSATRRGRRTFARWRAKARAWRRRARSPPRRRQEAARRRCRSSWSRTLRTRTRRWPVWNGGRAKHPEAAGHLAVDDVLVDSMRGRSSTWTRIRVNLRHVPEELRPPQETPDPDDDPTREWRTSTRREEANVSCSGSAAAGEDLPSVPAAEPLRAERRCSRAASCPYATGETAPCGGSALPCMWS